MCSRLHALPASPSCGLAHSEANKYCQIKGVGRYECTSNAERYPRVFSDTIPVIQYRPMPILYHSNGHIVYEYNYEYS